MTFLSDLRGLRGHTAQHTHTLAQKCVRESRSPIRDSHTRALGLASPLSGGPPLRYGHPDTGSSQLLQRVLGQGSERLEDTAQSGFRCAFPASRATKRFRAAVQIQYLNNTQSFQCVSRFARQSCTVMPKLRPPKPEFRQWPSSLAGACAPSRAAKAASTSRQRTGGASLHAGQANPNECHQPIATEDLT